MVLVIKHVSLQDLCHATQRGVTWLLDCCWPCSRQEGNIYINKEKLQCYAKLPWPKNYVEDVDVLIILRSCCMNNTALLITPTSEGVYQLKETEEHLLVSHNLLLSKWSSSQILIKLIHRLQYTLHTVADTQRCQNCAGHARIFWFCCLSTIHS